MLRYLKYSPLIFLLVFAFQFANAEGEVTPVAVTEEESVVAGDDSTTVYFFDDRFCSVCQDAKEFTKSIIDDYPHLQLEFHSITDVERIREVAGRAGIDGYQMMAPMIFIGDQLLQFNSFGSTQEEELVDAFKGLKVESDIYTFSIPFTDRDLVVREWSLPVITVVLGFLDGFNVCSLGALMLILSLVMILDSRKLIFIYGGIFILTTALVYASLILLWAQVAGFFVGKLPMFAYIVGTAAAFGSFFFFRQFWRFYRFGPTCESSDSDLVKRVTQKVKNSFEYSSKKPLAIISAIVTFAVVVTVVEIPCSIGIPMAFLLIMVDRGVSSSMGQVGYISVYLLFYLLVEIVIFIGVVMSKNLWFANSKLITWITFLGALILAGLALYYYIGAFLS